MTQYSVTVTRTSTVEEEAIFIVEADNEDEAIEKAEQEAAKTPDDDGDWTYKDRSDYDYESEAEEV